MIRRGWNVSPGARLRPFHQALLIPAFGLGVGNVPAGRHPARVNDAHRASEPTRVRQQRGEPVTGNASRLIGVRPEQYLTTPYRLPVVLVPGIRSAGPGDARAAGKQPVSSVGLLWAFEYVDLCVQLAFPEPGEAIERSRCSEVATAPARRPRPALAPAPDPNFLLAAFAAIPTLVTEDCAIEISYIEDELRLTQAADRASHPKQWQKRFTGET
jgi:hypothetical protein